MYSFYSSYGGSAGGTHRVKVLLRDPEVCRECENTYLSLYPLSRCEDHEGLERA